MRSTLSLGENKMKLFTPQQTFDAVMRYIEIRKELFGDNVRFTEADADGMLEFAKELGLTRAQKFSGGNGWLIDLGASVFH